MMMMMMKAPWWYEALWRVALPFALLRIWSRGRREPGYRQHVGERLGRYAPSTDRRAVIWVHAVSVGETRAAKPLIDAMMRRYPDHQIVLTHMTAAGRETGHALFGDRVKQAFLPYDVSFALTRFFDAFRPRFGVLMETELWPNLILRAAARGIPLYLVNARLSQKSADGYARVAGLTRATLHALAGVTAQTNADAARLLALGARAVEVAGNIKFDIDVPPLSVEAGHALRARFGRERRVWVAGSTRDGEETLLLEAMRRVRMPEDALLVLVPRHPQRFDDVALLVERAGFRCVRKSSAAPPDRDDAIVLGDTMGEMLAYYAAADVAFIGGTLLPLGGQNLIEPLAVGTPVVLGPSTYNFAEIARLAAAQGAALQVADADAVVEAVASLLEDPDRRSAMAGAGTQVLAAHRGATERTMIWLAAQLEVREPARR